MNNQMLAKLDDISSLNIIRDKFSIDNTRFKQGIIFVESVLNGTSKTKAYSNAFNVDMTKAGTLSSQLHRTKWVQEVIKFLRPDENSLYFGEIKDIISTGMTIINDSRSSDKIRVEAMRALQPYIKAEKIALDVTHEIIDSATKTASENIQKSIDKLIESGKMVNENGEVIDVEFIV